MYRAATWSILIAGAFLALLFGLSAFLAYHPSLLQSTPLELVARIVYGSRFAPIQYQPECAQYDPRVTYLLRPGRCRFARPEFDTLVEVNSFGLRDDEQSLIAPEVIVLGDSFAMGHGVEYREAFPQVLEQLLGRKVLNAGISSFGTARELMLLRLLDTSRARVIVIQHNANDFGENRSLLEQGTLPILPEEQYLALVQQVRPSRWDWLLPGMAVVKQIEYKMKSFLRRAKGENRDALEAEGFYNAVADARDLLRGRQVLILELNSTGGMDSRFINGARSRLADLDLDLTCIDMSAELERQDHFQWDGHLRPSGHEKVARILAEAIGSRPAPGGDLEVPETGESLSAPSASGS